MLRSSTCRHRAAHSGICITLGWEGPGRIDDCLEKHTLGALSEDSGQWAPRTLGDQKLKIYPVSLNLGNKIIHRQSLYWSTEEKP